MPRSISASLRVGLWEGHGKRCTYCGEPLSFRELEIDHIIPQHLTRYPKQLVELLKTLGLPPDFDVHGRLNLLPAHARCNSRKSGLVFQTQNIRFDMELAAKAAPRVLQEEERYLQRIRGDRILAALQLALESGDLTREQVASLVSPTKSGEAFEILKSIEFSSRLLSGLLERTDVEPLLDEPLLPRRSGLEELKMMRGAAETRSVRTCREWANAVNDGFHTATTYDIKEEAFFKRAYSLIRAFSKASVAETTYLDVVQAGLDSLDFLSVTLLPVLSGDDVREIAALAASSTSVGDLVRAGEVEIQEASRNYLSLIYSHLGKAFWATLRADLNNDGIEDMLVSTYTWATGGTLGFGEVIVLTRRGPREKFEVVNGVELLPG